MGIENVWEVHEKCVVLIYLVTLFVPDNVVNDFNQMWTKK